jgi:hypothetical protein
MIGEPHAVAMPEAMSAVLLEHTRRRELDPLSPRRLNQRNREQRPAGPARLLIDITWVAWFGPLSGAAGQRTHK